MLLTKDKNSDIVYYFAVLQKYVRSWPAEIVSSLHIQTSKQRAEKDLLLKGNAPVYLSNTNRA